MRCVVCSNHNPKRVHLKLICKFFFPLIFFPQDASQNLPDALVLSHVRGVCVELRQADHPRPKHHQTEEGGGDTGHH